MTTTSRVTRISVVRRRRLPRRRAELALEPLGARLVRRPDADADARLVGELLDLDLGALVLRRLAQQPANGFEVGVERYLDGHVRELLSAADRGVEDAIRGDL